MLHHIGIPAAAAAPTAVAWASLITPRSPLTRAAAPLTCASAWINRGSRGVPLIGKFSTARWVWARQRAFAGTSISPMESCSVLVSVMAPTLSP